MDVVRLDSCGMKLKGSTPLVEIPFWGEYLRVERLPDSEDETQPLWRHN